MTAVGLSEPLTPLDSMVQFAVERQLSVKRSGDDAALVFARGLYGRYEIAFTWFEDVEALHMACGFYLRVPANRQKELDVLIKALNERLSVGHFSHWVESEMILYRHSVLCPKAEPIPEGQRHALVSTALVMCDCYSTAFCSVVEGKKGLFALDSNIADTNGNA